METLRQFARQSRDERGIVIQQICQRLLATVGAPHIDLPVVEVIEFPAPGLVAVKAENRLEEVDEREVAGCARQAGDGIARKAAISLRLPLRSASVASNAMKPARANGVSRLSSVNPAIVAASQGRRAALAGSHVP
jgi:hypothetical protein